MMAGMAGGERPAPAAADGRERRVAELPRDHYAELVRLACLLVDDRGSGEEIVQEAFVRVYQAWARIEQPLVYLRSTVLNLARSRMRRRQVARRRVEPVAPAGPPIDE